MAGPKRTEEHIFSCALCGFTQIFTDWNDLSLHGRNHMRNEHSKVFAYRSDAVKSVTIAYEGVSDINDQEPHRIDPMRQFLKVASWMVDRSGRERELTLRDPDEG